MLDSLREAVTKHAVGRWRVSTSCLYGGYRVHVDLGQGVVVRARAKSLEQAEARAAHKVVAWVRFRQSAETGDLAPLLEESVAQARARQTVRPTLRLIKGGKP
jgi:hypothetical protein